MSNEVKAGTLFPQRSTGTDTVTITFFQMPQEVLPATLLKVFHKIKGSLPNSLYKDSITWITKRTCPNLG